MLLRGQQYLNIADSVPLNTEAACSQAMSPDIRVRQYVRRRKLTKDKRIEGMIKSAQSHRTPKQLRDGLRKHLDKKGIKWRR